ncbi:MAG: copper resistance CopC/CopD family protein [Acidimicrobiales bacterium]
MPALRRLTAAGALFLVASVLWAPRASAHAILLRTEPAPQTTAKTAPDTVRLHFSEPVEVTFGAVRVFDVNGTRIDSGTIRRTDGNREVVVPVDLKDGTYTVTWRVTSADGHPVRGGFGFFVGNPSTISAVAVPLDSGSTPVVTWGYGAFRFLWFGAFLGVVGLVAVRRWVWTPAVQAAGLTQTPAAAGFRRRFTKALPAMWVVLVVSGLALLVFQAATVSGLSLASSAKPEVLGDLLGTTFGRLWRIQLLLAVALGVPVFALVARRPLWSVPPRAWIVLLGVLAAGLCLATALNGHARTFATPALTVPSLALHLLAVAVWAGGLAALVILGRLGWRQVPGDDRPALLRHLVRRFTRLAVVAVAVVAVTGTIVTVGGFGAVSDFWDVTFGRVVAAKIALLVVAVALGARHRSRIPKLLAQPATAPGAVPSFERTSRAELVVLTAAVALAAALIALVPGRSIALAAKGPVNQERRAGDYTVQLYIDPTRVGDNEVHVTFVNARGLAAAEVANVEVSLAPAGSALQPIEMRLISPGHFVGDSTLAAPGRFSLAVSTPAAPGASTTFDFRLHGEDP